MTSASAADGGRLHEVLSRIPAAMAVLEGPDHVHIAASEAYEALLGRTGVLGLSAVDAAPALARQGFLDPGFTARRMDGDLVGQSRPGHGSTFTLCLPAAGDPVDSTPGDEADRDRGDEPGPTPGPAAGSIAGAG